ncbi:ribonuclease YeeF family protein [Sporosarcina sp. NPDC096371]|uniref:ribonuclease YeeF family protein n=1 Tax=Sporosarcina sp. NPDC096371 TaxID=3364530 RepID=UPI0038224557
MKVLDVSSFQNGLERNVVMLQRVGNEMRAIHKTIEGLVAMDASLTGEGGDAIRSFYQECHLPFLQFFDAVSLQFIDILKQMSTALDSLEPNPSGFIRQEFLEGEVEQGLQTIGRLTADLTDEANSIMDQVADIVYLPRLDDSNVQEGVRKAGIQRDETITQLYAFDAQQTGILMSFETNFRTMETWIADIDGLINDGLTDVNFSAESWKVIQRQSPIAGINNKQQFDSLVCHPRVLENDVEVVDFVSNETDVLGGLASTIGFNMHDWKAIPINAASSLGITVKASHEAIKDVNLALNGFGISRDIRITAQGKEKVVLKLERPDLIGVRKKTYSHKDATNYTKIYKRVDPMTNMKEAFKFAGNKIGYIGVATTVSGDIIHGVNNDQTASEIASNVTADVTIAGVSIAASAYGAATAGAYVGAIGGPLGVAVGAGVGLLFGVAATFFLNEVKLMDIDSDGKKDSVGDAIKKGTKGIIDKVSSWFK